MSELRKAYELNTAERLRLRNLPGCSFGPPPDPTRPKPRFIGLPSSKFDDLCQERVFRDQILKDNNTRVSVEAAARRLHSDGKFHIDFADNLVDMMPGSRNVMKNYARMGYTTHPITMRVLAPEVWGEAPFADDSGFPVSMRPQSVGGSSCASHSRSSRSHRSRRTATPLSPALLSSNDTMQRCCSAPAGDFSESAKRTGWCDPLSESCTSRAEHLRTADLIRRARHHTAKDLTII